jgi:enterochelin esterase-like enzyme
MPSQGTGPQVTGAPGTDSPGSPGSPVASTPAPGSPAPGPVVSDRGITFRLADADRRYAAVRLGQELHLPDDARTFARVPGGWELRLDRPPVARLEYRFEVTRTDGTTETVPDPANPRGAVELPGYREPGWLATPAGGGGARRELAVRAPTLGTDVHATLWSPAGLDDSEAAPLLLVHDGPEYDRAARLTRYLAAGVAEGRLPPLRAALLAPGERDEHYSANPAYASDLATAVVPALTAVSPATTTIGMGTSLGALAMFHAHRAHPQLADRLFLQSGSFFDPRHDAHEARFSGYDRVVAFVGAVRAAGGATCPVPTVLTCGAAEENVHNNRLLAATLAAHGYDVALHEVDDVHNWTAWRDALEPHLTGLIASAD